MGFGSKNKKKESKKGDKKHKKKSKSSSKNKDKKAHGKQAKQHAKKGSGAGHAKGPGQKKHKQAIDMMPEYTPPVDRRPGMPGPGGPVPQSHPGAARQHPMQQQRPQQPQQQQPRSGPPQLQQQQGPPRPGPPGPPGRQPGSGGQQGKQQRSSQSMSAESIGMQQALQQQQIHQQQQQRAKQQAPPARPPQQGQQQQQRPQQVQQQQQQPQQAPPPPAAAQSGQKSPQQVSPDMEKTEKKSGKKAGTGNKISKFLDIKFNQVCDSHRKSLGTLPNSVSRGAFDDNLCLNRFEDVICIDQTRVLFSDSSLYLNANWVVIEPGKKPDDPPKKMAIVGQLPLPECSIAFWTMIAENDIKGVLLFADDNEFLTFEADKTFPMNKATVSISPRITVTHTHRLAVSAEWTMNVYLMCRGDVRKYVHVHCYGWSGDDSIKLSNLWQLESVFRKYSSPHVYMSSAGVGRASTFAALKMAHARLHDDSCKDVNLNSSIVSLREHRLHSIQSLSQTITLHSALIQHIIDCPSFEKYEGDTRVRAFAEQYKEHLATSKE